MHATARADPAPRLNQGCLPCSCSCAFALRTRRKVRLATSQRQTHPSQAPCQRSRHSLTVCAALFFDRLPQTSLSDEPILGQPSHLGASDRPTARRPRLIRCLRPPGTEGAAPGSLNCWEPLVLLTCLQRVAKGDFKLAAGQDNLAGACHGGRIGSCEQSGGHLEMLGDATKVRRACGLRC